jgi:hypothetical protein
MTYYIDRCLFYIYYFKGPSWSRSYGSWIYNYLCNQCLSPLKLWGRTRSWRGVLDTTLCDKVCQWFATCQWFSPATPVSSTNKTDRHDITEILLKVALNTINYFIFVYLQGLSCLGMILYEGQHSKTQTWLHYLQFTFILVGVLSARCWTAVISLVLYFLHCKSLCFVLRIKWWLCLFAFGFVFILSFF